MPETKWFGWPHEAVPDGAIMAPHHLTYAVLAGLLVCAVVWDNYRNTEPILAAAGLLVALFGFLFVWPYYSGLGAALTLAGLLAALGGLLVQSLWWTEYPALPHALALVCVLVALDDAVSHAFGVWTPADWAWRVFIVPVIT